MKKVINHHFWESESQEIQETRKCKVCKETLSYHKLLIKKYPDYHCKPVNSSGSVKSKIALIGLAPGLHGANKTGIPFTSDFSGEVIRKILHKLCLQDIFITNAVRCYPKNNKPSSIDLMVRNLGGMPMEKRSTRTPTDLAAIKCPYS